MSSTNRALELGTGFDPNLSGSHHRFGGYAPCPETLAPDLPFLSQRDRPAHSRGRSRGLQARGTAADDN